MDRAVTEARLRTLHAEWPWSRWRRRGLMISRGATQLTPSQIKGLVLLYVKGCLPVETDTREYRTVSFRCAIGMAGTAKSEAQWFRLRHLVEHANDNVVSVVIGAAPQEVHVGIEGDGKHGDEAWGADSSPTSLKPKWQSFDDFCGIRSPHSMAPWAAPDAHDTVFFRKYEGSLAQRRQVFGSCFEQAPVVMALYVFWKHNVAAGVAPGHAQVDLTAFLLRCRSAAELWAFVDSDSGGHSLESLPQLTGLSESDIITLNSTHLRRYRASVADEVMRYFDEYGPGLISNLVVTHDLRNNAIARHDGACATAHPIDAKRDTERHAMVFVGYRTDAATGELKLLVQNWWAEKQFLEMDLDYLIARSASLSFIVNKSCGHWPSAHPQVEGVRIESAVGGRETLGAAERV